MKIKAFIAASVDGFIALPDGGLDWLPSPSGDEDYGYKKFISDIDVILMGRNTFEKVISFDIDWPYQSINVYVLSSKLKSLPDKTPSTVEIISGDLINIVENLKLRGFENLYIDGGKTIQSFINAELLSEITISRIPVLIGSGIPLFGSLKHDIHLRLLDFITYKNSIDQFHY